MFLGTKKLLKLVKYARLVENLSERELKTPEGTGFDLRVGEIFTISGRGFLGISERRTCPIEPFAAFDPEKPSTVAIKPNDFYLFRTIETVNLPVDLVGIVKPRSTLMRMGLFLRTAAVNPGYSGQLVFAVKNEGPTTVSLELGARVAHILFARIEGDTAPYRGQWQGGRVTALKKEKQV